MRVPHLRKPAGLCYETRGKEFELCSSRRSRAFPFSGLSRWPQWSIQGGHGWIAWRFSLLISSRRVVGRLGPFQAAGGGKSTGKKGVCSRPAGAFAELAHSTCEPGVPENVHQRPRPAGTEVSPTMAGLWPYSGNHAVLPEPLACAWGRSASGASVFPSVQWEE